MQAKSPDAPPSRDKEALRFWLQLLKASRHIENELRDRLRRAYSTTLPQFDVMAMLEKSETGLRMSAISAGMMVSNGNVTGIVDRLVTDGLVMRISIKGDRRATLVRLTPQGVTKFSAMACDHKSWVDELFTPISHAELDNSMTTLAKIRELT